MKDPSRPFKAMSVIIALSVLGLALMVTSAHALFGTKVAPLFGMSPDALAGAAQAAERKTERSDGGNVTADGGAKRPRASPLGASKSGMVFHDRDFEGQPIAGEAAPDAGPKPRLAPLGASKAFGPFRENDFGGLTGLGSRGSGGGGIGNIGNRQDAGAK